ncbi:hypothetical protein MYX76_10575 [Desulfobacterota bacterium AH_259_B03_O07]|nr:hypothetical protein [Desulfobacterota bacterium AH_259_B03_O07]
MIKLKGRNAELISPLNTIAQYILGDEATAELNKFIEDIFIPQSRDHTMLTFQEDIVRILDELSQKEKPYLSKIELELHKLDTSQYRFITRRQIASVARSLGFTTKRDGRGYYVECTHGLLMVWKERYIYNQDTSQSSQSTQNQENNESSIIEVSVASEQNVDSNEINKESEINNLRDELRSLQKELLTLIEEVHQLEGKLGHTLALRKFRKALAKYQSLGGKYTYNPWVERISFH